MGATGLLLETKKILSRYLSPPHLLVLRRFFFSHVAHNGVMNLWKHVNYFFLF